MNEPSLREDAVTQLGFRFEVQELRVEGLGDYPNLRGLAYRVLIYSPKAG